MKLQRSRLSARQSERLLEHFVAGTPARTAAELAGVNRNTATLFYHRLREVIAERMEDSNPLAAAGLRQAFTSIFGDRNEAGAETGAERAEVALVLLALDDKVYSTLIPRGQQEAMLAHLRTSALAEVMVRLELLDVRDLLEPRRRQRNAVETGRRTRIGIIENFQSQARRNLRRYNGVPAHHLHLFLRECEWRFNTRSPRRLLETLTGWLAEQK
jgi:transposase